MRVFNLVNEDRLLSYMRDILVFFILTGLWFLSNHSFLPNIWFQFFPAYTIVSALALVFLLVKKPVIKINFKITLPIFLLRIISAIAIIALVIAFYRFPQNIYGIGSSRLIWLVILSAGIGMISLLTNSEDEPRMMFIWAMLFGGVVYLIADFVPEIQSTPFSLAWSEGSRIYNASLFFSEKIYGQRLPLPVLHPSRYLMQSLPFLFGIKSILIHRLWQVLLWIGITFMGAWLMARKIGNYTKACPACLTFFLFLFFFQGAVYFHLMVCVILVLIGYQKEKPLKTLLFVILASIWAGISRINWIPVPALLAISLYLIETPFNGKDWIGYLKKPVLWIVVGHGTAFSTKQIYQTLSGENPAVFDSALNSELIWNRLLPNQTFSFGILPAIFVICLPMLIYLFLKWRNKSIARIHWLRTMGLVGIPVAFFLTGVLVSLKIGGGADLHNLDAFLVFFALITLSFAFGRVVSDDLVRTGHSYAFPTGFMGLVLLLVFVMPVSYAFTKAGTWVGTKQPQGEAELNEIQTALDIINQEPGEILFVTERQLITMGKLKGVSVYPDYEKVFLMEMAMANNQDYLQEFYRLIEDHYFKAILMEPVSLEIRNVLSNFGAENNIYVRNVVSPMLNEYQVALSWDNGNINLLIPKGQPQLLNALQIIQVP